jgi:hypothetical protein
MEDVDIDEKQYHFCGLNCELFSILKAKGKISLQQTTTHRCKYVRRLFVAHQVKEQLQKTHKFPSSVFLMGGCQVTVSQFGFRMRPKNKKKFALCVHNARTSSL